MTDNSISVDKIQDCLGAHPWASLIQVFDEVDSTNTLAKTLAAQGAPEGTILIADRQTGGRGRLGRSFLSPGDVGVYYSLILRPGCSPGELMHLTCATAVAMCEAAEEAFGFRPGIKWTNDLVVGRKKLGGILTELSLNPKTGLVDWAVVGIGINCRQREADFDPSIRDMACSAAMVLGQDADRNVLIGTMTKALHRMSVTLLAAKDAILEQYRRDCVTLGKQISVVRGDEVFHALALSVDPEGGLVVRLEDGTEQTVNSGEVSIRGFYGYI
ncbi:MAG: biotin--[Oscillospiraceae bacterium]|nr:biotin--[acetyl-CoA-carboxylase] ligase [Oscillospiraceae bacterium]